MPKKKTTKKKAAKGPGGRPPGQWVDLQQDSVATFRKTARLSRSKLAEMLGVSPTSVQNWETKRSVPVRRYQQRLVELMNGEVPAAAPAPTAAGSPARASSDGVELQVTRLAVAGEVLKGYLTTAQGGKLSPDQLVALTRAVRGALS